jgi:hypothetical protein
LSSISHSKLKSIINAAELAILNQFIDVGESNGCYNFVVFTRVPIAPSIISVDNLPIDTAEFKHLFIYEGSTLIGSLIVSRKKYTTLTHNAVTYIKEDSNTDFVCPTETDSSGVYLMTNGHGAFSAVIAFPNSVSDLVVQDKEI